MFVYQQHENDLICKSTFSGHWWLKMLPVQKVPLGGICINSRPPPPSSLRHCTPTQVTTFLGFFLGSWRMTIYLTHETQLKLRKTCQNIFNKPRPTIRLAAQLLRLMTFNFAGVTYGSLHYRRLDMKNNKGIHIQYPIIMLCHQSWGPPSYPIHWCFYNWIELWISMNLYSRALGPIRDKNHLNYLKMLAIKLTLACFKKQLRGKHVKLMVDNMAAICILNNMGISRTWKLNELNRDIWTWCIKQGMYLTVVHNSVATNRVANRVADRESRLNRSWDRVDS